MPREDHAGAIVRWMGLAFGGSEILEVHVHPLLLSAVVKPDLLSQ